YMTGVPGASHRGPLPPLTADEAALAAALKAHVEAIAGREHNLDHYDELEKVARYIEGVLESYGHAVGRQVFTAGGKPVRNIDVALEPAGSPSDPDVIVVGAHYDSVTGSPGANDNATGAAAVLEFARLLADLAGKSGRRIRLVLFVNEEPPYFQTEDMGSLHYADALAARGEGVVAMYSLETIGYYSDAPGSQQYPAPFGLMYPDRGDFVAFVGLLNSRPLLQETIRSFRAHTAFPTVGGVAPGLIPGIGWSDHWAFAQHGFQAVMITDTALFRYPHYHLSTDTPDKVDFDKLARVVKGVERVVREIARRPREGGDPSSSADESSETCGHGFPLARERPLGGRARQLRRQLGIQRDVRLEHARHRAVGLGVGGKRVELGAVDVRHAPAELEVHGGDGPVAGHLLERQRRLRRKLLRREVGAPELRGQRHGEASGVRGGNQLLGIGAGAALESRRERIRRVLERAALGGEAAGALLQVATPAGRCGAFHGWPPC